MKRTIATVLVGLGIIVAGAIQTAAHNRTKPVHRSATAVDVHLSRPLV